MSAAARPERPVCTTSPPIAAAVHASTRLDFDAFKLSLTRLDFDAFKLSPAPGVHQLRPLIRPRSLYECVQLGGLARLIGRAVRHNVALLILARPCDRFGNAATKLAGVLARAPLVELRRLEAATAWPATPARPQQPGRRCC